MYDILLMSNGQWFGYFYLNVFIKSMCKIIKYLYIVISTCTTYLLPIFFFTISNFDNIGNMIIWLIQCIAIEVL